MAIASKKVRISSRDRTQFRIRKKISGTSERPRITVFRTGKHIYAQAICDLTGETLASASTLDKEVLESLKSLKTEGPKSTKSKSAAKMVGTTLGKRCLAKNVSAAVYDRNGLFYHGRVQAVAEGLRESGLTV